MSAGSLRCLLEVYQSAVNPQVQVRGVRDIWHVSAWGATRILPNMPKIALLQRVASNPAAESRSEQWRNIFGEIGSRPLAGAVIFLLALGGLASGLWLGQSILDNHATTLLGGLRRWGIPFWIAVFVLCVAGLTRQARKDIDDATEGWLAALPQMPDAMHRWSRWRLLCQAILQGMFLLVAVMMLHRAADVRIELHAGDWLPAVVVPLIAWTLLPLSARPRPESTSSRQPVRAREIRTRPAAVPVYWQWADYKDLRWSAGFRWGLGLAIMLIPATATVVQVGLTLIVGGLFLQWYQLWSSCLRVISEASALTAALPRGSRPYLGRLAILPLFSVLLFGLSLAAVLSLVGAPPVIGLGAALAICGALLLQAASVMAWRFQRRFIWLRSAAVLLVWMVLSQSMPFLTPLIWLVLFAGLIARAWRVTG